MIAIIVGNLLATIFVVLNSLPGAYYHIGFPVVNRYVWGMYGSSFAIWNRILLSLVWYGYQAWIGGECIYVMLKAIWPSIESRIPNHLAASTGTTSAYFVSYVIFMLISLPVVWIHPHKLQKLFVGSSVIVGITLVVLLIWSLATMGSAGFGDTLSSSPSVNGASTGWNIVFGIISTIGSIAAGILNQNDYARFASRPRDAILGQMISFPLYGILSSIIGILVTAATQQRYGEAYWMLPELFVAVIDNGGSRSRAAAFFVGAALVISQIGVNVPGNSLSGGFDFAATFPKFLNIRRGAYLTVILSIACCPWKLVNTATIFLTVLSSYSVFLGPMTGLMVSSYMIVNKRKIKVDDLFRGNSQSIYWFTYGINWRAVVAVSLPFRILLENIWLTLNTVVLWNCSIAARICCGSQYKCQHTYRSDPSIRYVLSGWVCHRFCCLCCFTLRFPSSESTSVCERFSYAKRVAEDIPRRD